MRPRGISEEPKVPGIEVADPTLEPDQVDSQGAGSQMSLYCLSHHLLFTDLMLFPVKWVAGPASLKALLQEIALRNPYSNMTSCYWRWFVFITVALKHTNGKVVKTL